MTRHLVLASLALGALVACAPRDASDERALASCRARLGELAPQVHVDAVEPRVCEALVKALRRMPAPHREALSELTVRRAPTFALPQGQPLATRIYAAAVLGSYASDERVLTIYDSALALDRARTPEEATRLSFWREGKPSPEELRAFLETTQALLGITTWEDYAKAISRCSGRDLRADEPGSVEVLEATIACGHRLIGVPLRLDEAILHELGHALTYEGDRLPAQVTTWEALGRWRELPGNQVARAFVMALRAAEPTPDHCASWYGCTSALEDVAESYRLFVDHSAELAARSPERWLVLNALASGRVHDRFPGPREALQAGLVRLLAGEPALDAEVALAALRVHADLARDLELPPGDPVELPPDGPPDLPTADALVVELGGRSVRPTRAAVTAMVERRALAALIATWGAEGPPPAGESVWHRVGREAAALDAKLEDKTQAALGEVWSRLEAGPFLAPSPAELAAGANAPDQWVRGPAERVRLWLKLGALAEALGEQGQARGARVKACEEAHSMRLVGLGQRLARFVPGCE